MRLGFDYRLVFTAALAAAWWSGCSGGSGDPLGGPHGGSTALPAPDDGGGTTVQSDPMGGSASSSGSSAPSSSGQGGPSGSGSSGGHVGPSSSSGGSSGSSSGGSSSGIFGFGSSASSSGGSVGSSTSSSGATGSSSSSGGSTTPPTWTQIYDSYLAPGTIGNCVNCHSGTSTPSGMYSFLQGKGQLGGASPALTSSSTSCLSWYGGNMPPLGPQSVAAVSEMNAWAAAGAKDN
jgi:hypothetical protein